MFRPVLPFGLVIALLLLVACTGDMEIELAELREKVAHQQEALANERTEGERCRQSLSQVSSDCLEEATERVLISESQIPDAPPDRRKACSEREERLASSLDQARAEIRELKAGLQRAVAELNEQQQQARQRVVVSRSAGGGGSRGTSNTTGVYVRQADSRVNRGDGSWFVQGTVHNTNSHPVSGSVVVEITIEGRSTEEEHRLTIPPNSVVDWDIDAYGGDSGSSISTTARWEGDS